MVLTKFSIDRAMPKEKAYKLSDGAGLVLLINPNGKKLWRFRYHFAGVEKMIGFGSYPEITLASARQKCADARRQVAEGVDPSLERQLARAAKAAANANSFGAVVKDYLEALRANGLAETTIDKNVWLLQDLASPLAGRPITEITSAELLALLKRIEKTGRRETARRLRGTIGSVFRFAIVNLRATNDPSYALRGALLRPIVQHRPAITDEQELGALMRSIDEYDGWPTCVLRCC